MTTKNEFTVAMEDKLEDALVMLAAGVPLETVLTNAGEDANTLRPLLQAAVDVESLQPLIPIPQPEASLQKMLTHSANLRAASPVKVPAPTSGTTRLANLFRFAWPATLWTGFRMAALTAGVVLVFFLGAMLGGGLTLAAQESLPGQPLYSLKRIEETIRLGVTQNSHTRQHLLETFNRRRRLETELLLQQGQRTLVTFTGDLQSITQTAVTLNGFFVQITPDTKIQGQLAVGAHVYLEATTQPPDRLMALTIVVLDPVLPVSTSTPTPTASPTMTPSPTTSPTMTPVKAEANDTLDLPPSPTATDMVLNGADLANDSNDTQGDADSSNDEVEDDDANENDDANSNDDDNLNDNGDDDSLNENDDDDGDANENDDDDTNDNGDDESNDNDDEDDHSGSSDDGDNSGSNNSGQGSSDDRDDKDDDKEDD